MIDYVKLRPLVQIGLSLKNSSYLKFKKVFNEYTGDSSKKSWAEYNKIKFTVYDNGKTQIDGSIHYYANRGNHNYDDFTYSRMAETIHDIENRFELNASRLKIVNLEFGVNICPPIETQDVLKGMLMHKRHRFKSMYIHNNNADYIQAPHDQFYVKAYNKALQYKLNEQIFRFEIKLVRSKMINKYGIFNLIDLLNKQKLEILSQRLIEVWNQVLFSDPTLERFQLSDKKWQQVLQWQNPIYWNELDQYCKTKDKNKFEREMKSFRDLIQLQSCRIQDQISKMIEDKISYLMNH